jgi:HK97 family phage major capsid protein
MTTQREAAENILTEIRAATAQLDVRDKNYRERMGALESTVNNVLKRLDRPSGGNGFGAGLDERKSALDLLATKHAIINSKRDAAAPPEPNFSAEQVNEAQLAIRGLRSLMHTTHIDAVPLDQRKALSSFSFGSSGFLLPPEMSNTILSCLVLATNVAALMQNVQISGASIKFMVDNEFIDAAAWACDSSCFANNPTSQIGSGLGEIEIKPESLRYIVCVTKELLEDAAVNLETWLLGKASIAFNSQISDAIINGDGNGKPMGILNPLAGIPIMDTGAATPAGQFSWQDLVLLRWSVPASLQADGGSLLMNQYTFAQAATLSDANNRPLMTVNASEGAPFLLGGVPVVIVTQMPSVAPGATPIAYGAWRNAYTVVTRRGVTFLNDPYSGGWCNLMKFDARVGGGVTCARAAALLCIR